MKKKSKGINTTSKNKLKPSIRCKWKKGKGPDQTVKISIYMYTYMPIYYVCMYSDFPYVFLTLQNRIL